MAWLYQRHKEFLQIKTQHDLVHAHYTLTCRQGNGTSRTETFPSDVLFYEGLHALGVVRRLADIVLDFLELRSTLERCRNCCS